MQRRNFPQWQLGATSPTSPVRTKMGEKKKNSAFPICKPSHRTILFFRYFSKGESLKTNTLKPSYWQHLPGTHNMADYLISSLGRGVTWLKKKLVPDHWEISKLYIYSKYVSVTSVTLLFSLNINIYIYINIYLYIINKGEYIYIYVYYNILPQSEHDPALCTTVPLRRQVARNFKRQQKPRWQRLRQWSHHKTFVFQEGLI